MHDITLITTVTGGLAAALVLGYVTFRAGLSPIVGYLLAGIAVSPNTPGFVADRHLAEQLAEIGVVLLMFGVGLHFHVKELIAVRNIAIPGAIVQSTVATLLGLGTASLFGWSFQAGIVFGLALSVASTVVLTRVLSDNGDLHTPTGHIAIGWLIVEDLFTVLVLVLLPTFVASLGPTELAKTAAFALLKVAVLVAITFFAGGRIIPRFLEGLARTRSRELFTLGVLVVALGVAVGSALVFQVSMALGAFLAGMVVGRSEFSLRAASEALPMRDAFSVLFFVSVGMLFDVRYLLESYGIAAATIAIVVIGKPLAALAITLLYRYPLRTALEVSIALGQVGEFSFILASLGTQLGIFPAAASNALVVAAIVSISINPILYRLAGSCAARLSRGPLIAPSDEKVSATRELNARYRAIIVGYGPVGRTLFRLLRENEIQVTVIEMNMETARELRQGDVPVVYGDASQPGTLEEARIASTATLILSSSSLAAPQEIVRLARELNPNIRILARSAYLREQRAMLNAGATEVFSGEGEVALALTESVLRQLGASGEHIDRERDRVRRDLVEGEQETRAKSA